MQQQTIYMRLLDEGVDVWRPVQAIEQAPGIFVICEQPVPDDEHWQFSVWALT